MQFTKLRRVLVASLLAASAGVGGGSKVASAQDIGGSFTFGNGGVSFQFGANARYGPYFEDQLSAYGQWVQDPQYGLVFVPSTAGFQPYTNGYWADTDAGLTWVSAYPFGNITEHYGRWVMTYYGWAWIPGDQWSPAWVAWYDTGYDLGWAPLGPYDEPIIDYGLTYVPYLVIVQQINVHPYYYRYRDRFPDYYARSRPIERPAPILRAHNYELRRRYIAPERLGRLNAYEQRRAEEVRRERQFRGPQQQYLTPQQYQVQRPQPQVRQPQQPQYRAPAPQPQPMRPQPMQRPQQQPQYRAPQPQPMRPQPMQPRPQPQQRPQTQQQSQFRQRQEQQERQQLQQQLNKTSQEERQRLGPNASQSDRQRLEQKQQQRQQQETQRLEQKQQQRRNQR